MKKILSVIMALLTGAASLAIFAAGAVEAGSVNWNEEIHCNHKCNLDRSSRTQRILTRCSRSRISEL